MSAVEREHANVAVDLAACTPDGHPIEMETPTPGDAEPSYLPKLIAWEVTRSCNLSCVHFRASAEKGPYPGELTLEQGKALIDDIVSFSNPVLILTGGDPLMREDIFEIVGYARAAGLRVVMSPNGTLVTPEVARKMKEAGIPRISVSIDFPTAELHDKFRGVPGAFDGAVRGVRTAIEAGVEVQINSTITRLNVEYLDDLLALAEELGAVALHPFLLVPTGRGKDLGPEELPPEDYERTLEELQGRLALLSRRRKFARHSVVVVMEGMDASGKGGSIRRITAALDARQYRVVPISAPTPEEKARPYLWRFWFQLPPRGNYTIFDRTWYGRVLVERVRGFADAPDWQRAYEEINEFERQLVEHQVIVAKFWMSVSPAEQLARFAERDRNRLKRFKVDAEDWINRKLWKPYQAAARDMLALTSTPHAPWTIVPADDKRHARLTVLRGMCERIESALG